MNIRKSMEYLFVPGNSVSLDELRWSYGLEKSMPRFNDLEDDRLRRGLNDSNK